MSRSGKGHDSRPDRVWRTGTESFTIVEAHPYHQPVGRIDHKGAGEYVVAYDPQCPRCREELGRGDHADNGV